MAADLFNFFLGSFTTLFSIINPLGAMPVFLALTANDSASRRLLMARKASIYMCLILVFFLVAGNFVMNFFGISLESIRIAGGLVVLHSGFHLLNGREKGNLSKKTKLEAIEKPDISLTPLALPLLSGPGSIAATITMASQTREESFLYDLVIIVTICCIGLIAFLTLSLSQRLSPVLGRSGLEAITKIMGFIAMTVGVQFILIGMKAFIENNLDLF